MENIKFNIKAAWAVDREFVYIVGPVVLPLVAFGLTLDSFWSFGCPLAPFGVPLGSLWLTLGALGLPLAVIWVPFRSLWLSWGSLGAPGSIWAPFSEQMLLKYRACAQNLAFWNLPADAADAAEPAEVVSASAARDLPSTCAGGQDDVSSNKLPQIIVWRAIGINQDSPP